jgi:hypothetical protein
MQMEWQTRQLADRLRLTGTSVFFNEGWVDYEDRANYLLDADLGVSTHFLHVETTFSFRSRMLDYLWAGLPIVATEGDAFGRMIPAEGLGVAVPERDPGALADALERALYDTEFAATCRRNVARVRENFTWGTTLEPLVEFCRRAERAPDGRCTQALLATEKLPAGIIARNVRYARARLREGGPQLVARRGVGKARRLIKTRLGGRRGA